MIDKIIERLEREYVEVKNDNDLSNNRAIFKAIDMVKQVAEESDWIKCSDSLPEKHSFEKVLVSIKSENGDTVRIGVKSLGPWYVDGYPIKEHDEVGEVVAWQPIPKPFKEAENGD